MPVSTLRLPERSQPAVRVPLVAQRDVVPQLQPAAVGARAPGRRPVPGPDVDLGVRPAGAGRPVRPPVVLGAEQLDRQPELVPGLLRRGVRAHLLVPAEHGRVQQAPLQPEHLPQQLETPPLALRPVVVAERPRAEHLEHRQVGVVAYLVQVGGAQAALYPGEPAAEGMRLAGQVRRQRVHSRRGEQHRIAGRGQQRTAPDRLMPAVPVEIDESGDGFVGIHDSCASRYQGTGNRPPSRTGENMHRRTVPGRRQGISGRDLRQGSQTGISDRDLRQGSQAGISGRGSQVRRRRPASR